MSNSNYEKNYVGRGEKTAFAFAGGGQNFCYTLVTNYLMYYYINVFHVDTRAVGLMLLIVGVWDVINNPLVGIIIDKTRTKRGKMIPYLRWFMFPLALFTVLLFSGPQFLSETSPMKLFYMLATYLIWELCYTFTDVSYWALSSAISPNPDERARILTFQNIIINVMCALVQVLVPIFLDFAQSEKSKFSLSDVFFMMGLFAGVVGIGLFAMSGLFVKERIKQSSEVPSVKESFMQLVNNPALRIVIISNLLYALSGVGLVFSTYYFIDVLGYASLSFISQIPYAIFSFFSYSLIEKVKKKLNNKQIMISAFLFLGILQMTVYFISTSFYYDIKTILPLIMTYQSFLGLFSGFLGVIPNEMLGEATDYSEWKTGKRNEGISFSLKITTTKINGTVTQAFSAMLLSLIGYVTSSNSARIEQPEDVQKGIWLMFYLVPAIITIISAVPFFFYPLTDEKRHQMYDELESKRKEL